MHFNNYPCNHHEETTCHLVVSHQTHLFISVSILYMLLSVCEPCHPS